MIEILRERLASTSSPVNSRTAESKPLRRMRLPAIIHLSRHVDESFWIPCSSHKAFQLYTHLCILKISKKLFSSLQMCALMPHSSSFHHFMNVRRSFKLLNWTRTRQGPSLTFTVLPMHFLLCSAMFCSAQFLSPFAPVPPWTPS